MNLFHVDEGSFRDPSGRVYSNGQEIYRVVSASAALEYAHVRDSGLLSTLIAQGSVVATEEADQSIFGADLHPPSLILRHALVPFVSYPYEWSFPLLKAAALLHLDIHIAALGHGITLSDATAYNVQFYGIKPIFIDVLSFRRYREGEVWAAHRQFCEQFLNPLLLRSVFGIPHNAWFRGNLEGIETSHLARMLPWWRNLSFTVFSHITLQAKLQAKATANPGQMVFKAKKMRLPKPNFERLLIGLRDWIARLKPRNTEPTVWQRYAEQNTYTSEEHEAKRRFVTTFCTKLKPRILWDLGCNSGEYSEIALSSGASKVIGFDSDQRALEYAYERAGKGALDLLPLFQDGANPSPSQGWANTERKHILARSTVDAMIALAFVHHLAIARNVPLEMASDWLIGIAPRGIIEFVEKTDPTVRQLLALRKDIFSDYSRENFEAVINARARIIRSEKVSSTGRTLYFYDRSRSQT
jgi:ribosomal protein L11 methylase PrmA